MRAARLVSVAAAVALAACAAGAAAQPRVALGVGGTGASSDGPKQTGTCASLAALWGFGSHLELGPMLFADDLGSRIGRLRDPHDGSDLGAVAELHRYAYGGAWRADVPLTTVAGWRARLGATWGYYRIQDDRVGVVERAISAVGGSLGAGLSHAFLATLAIGVSARYHHLFETRQDHYASATVDLSWQPAAPAPARPPRKATTLNGN